MADKKGIMKFLNDWVFKPNYVITKTIRNFMDNMGILDPIDQFIYTKIEDPLFYMWFTNSYDLKIINDEVIPSEEEGCCVFAANHQSIMDPLVSGLAIVHNSRRIPFQLTKAELGKDPMLGNFVDMNQTIFIERGEHDIEALEKCVSEIKENNRPILVYPEGTYGPGNGVMLEFKTGVARIAWDAQVPIIPMATWGIDKIMGKEASRSMKPPKSEGKLRVKFGDPIPLSRLFPGKSAEDQISREEFQKGTEKVQQAVQGIWSELNQKELEQY